MLLLFTQTVSLTWTNNVILTGSNGSNSINYTFSYDPGTDSWATLTPLSKALVYDSPRYMILIEIL